MNRKLLVSIHIYLSAIFLPFLFLMPLTGFLYLIGEKGSSTRELVYSINESLPTQIEERQEWIQTNFDRFDPDFKYEYIRSGANNHILRPSHKTHYNLLETSEGVEFYKVSPNFLQSLVELHKGHGPQLFKRLETIFALGLLLIMVSGVWLAVMSPIYRKKILIGLFLGSTIFLGALCI